MDKVLKSCKCERHGLLLKKVWRCLTLPNSHVTFYALEFISLSLYLIRFAKSGTTPQNALKESVFQGNHSPNTDRDLYFNNLCVVMHKTKWRLQNIVFPLIFSRHLHTKMILFTNPFARAGYDTRSIFKAEFNRFEFRVFLLLN